MHLAIDMAFVHELCINVLYGSLVLLGFVLVERLVFYGLLYARTGRLRAAIRAGEGDRAARILKRRDLLTRSLAAYVDALRHPEVKREQLEDLSSALFIKVKSRIGARLWLLDTIVTAAPLLGLLGTILGIMDTFNALSAGGISDPAAVSRGIAAALLATAVGIGTALFGLLGHNVLHSMADALTEHFKVLILASERLVSKDVPGGAVG